MAVARDLPADVQNEIARRARAGRLGDRFTPEEEAEQVADDAEEARGEDASDDEVRAIWAKHGL